MYHAIVISAISEQLTKLNVVSPLLMLDEMSSLREQYRHSVHRMLVAAVHKSNKVSKNTANSLEGMS